MLDCDTSILFPALEASHPQHAPARAWLESQIDDEELAPCELILVETHTLLRNPLICSQRLSSAAAVQKIANLRGNPAWLILDYPGPGLMEKARAVCLTHPLCAPKIRDDRSRGHVILVQGLRDFCREEVPCLSHWKPLRSTAISPTS